MLSRVRSAFVLAMVAGAMSSCGGDRVTTSMVPEADRLAEGAHINSGQRSSGQPLGKLAIRGSARPAVVVATVLQDGTPLSGVAVEISRSVSGRMAKYIWSGSTDANGEARVEIDGVNVNGYYRARAVQGESVLDSWSSIPVNAGYEVAVELPVGEPTRVTGVSVSIVGSWGYAGTDMVETISRNLVAAILEQGLVDSTVAVALVGEFTSELETSLRDSAWSPIRRFRVDGTYIDQDGAGSWTDTGTWSISGETLTFIEEGGLVQEGSVDVDGDRLTLTFTREQYMRIVLQTAGELNEEDQEFFDAMLKEDDVIRFFFEAR